MPDLDHQAQEKLAEAQNIWVASVRPSRGDLPRPHLTPVWFCYPDDKLYISIDANSVKAGNLRRNPNITLALEDGLHPVICEGTARFIEPPYPAGVIAEFLRKYEWDITTEAQYNQVIEITPLKWLSW